MAASGFEGLQVAIRAALAHPMALVLLLGSIALAVAAATLPLARPWAGMAGWLVVLGVAAYVATVAVAHRVPADDMPQPLRRIRSAIQERLRERERAERSRVSSELTDVLADAIRYIDEQLAPALSELLRLHERTSRSLRLWEAGKLPAPDPIILDRLRTQDARQAAAIEQSLREAANAAATLMVILDEGDDTRVAERARSWSQELLQLHDTIEEVLRGDEWREADSAPPDAPLRPAEPNAGPVRPPQAPDRALPEVRADSLVRPLEEALRRLNKLAALANCELIQLLPCTLRAEAAASDDEGTRQATPLRQAQLLREVIVAGIGRLSPPDLSIGGDHANRALQYRILHEEYVMGLSNKQVLARHPIGESTLYRHRREAVDVLARELATREKLLCASRGRDPRTTATLIDYLG